MQRLAIGGGVIVGIVIYIGSMTRAHLIEAKLSRSILDAARHPSQGGCWASSKTQENENRGTEVAQSQGASPVPLVLWSMLMARTIQLTSEWGRQHSSSSAFASFRSSVSNPSVNQP